MTDPAYDDIIHYTDKPWCWSCGGSAPWLERAHLHSGSGSAMRMKDRRAVNLLCASCHRRHVSSKSGNGILNNANMLWIKQRRDPEYYDEQFITRIWIGNPPIPDEPIWASLLYDRTHGGRFVGKFGHRNGE